MRCLARGIGEEGGVEVLHVGRARDSPHVARSCQLLTRHAGGQQLFVAAEGNRFRAFSQVDPELFDIARTGKPSRDADDRHVVLSCHWIPHL